MNVERKKPSGPDQPDREPPKSQPAGAGSQQQQSGTGQQYGEGSYSGTRQYNEGMKEHMEHHDVEREAREAAPRSAAEEKELKEAERLGRSKARGEGAAPDGNAADDGEASERDPNT